jgi:hypothetical protein
MASPQGGRSPYPDSYSAQDRILAEKTEEAIHDGRQLEAWMRRQSRELEFPLNLHKTYTLVNQAFGYFSELELNGKPTSVMGCRQFVEFGRADGPGDAGERLRDFVLGEFLRRAHWTYPDGYPGGFTIDQSLYRTPAGEYRQFPESERRDCVDWRRLGKDYQWVLYTVQIHDFVMNFGPIVKRFQEAACVAAHADFVHVVERPEKGCALEVAVGYPFVEVTPIPNVFGFGPGKFGLACKLYSFRLMDDKRIAVTMDFAAAPRCRRIFDFGPNAFDPVYGGAEILSKLTFGAFRTGPFHDVLDAKMLGQHSRVHQALMEGASKIWREWASGGRA